MANILPDSKPDLIVELVHAVERTEMIYNACKLNVFDILSDLKSPSSAEQIAKEMGGGNVDILEKLLNTCVSLRLLRKDFMINAKKVAVFSNTIESEEYLTTKSKHSLLSMVAAARHQYPLDELVKKNACDNSRGWFHSVEDNNRVYKEAHHRFRRYYLKQDGYAKTSVPLLRSFNLSKFKSAVDLGGGNGSLCRALAQLYPDMKVTNVDMPHVIDFAKELEPENSPRIEYCKADLLKDPLPKADLYIVGHLVHMYNDKACAAMFSKVNNCINNGGAILLLEKVLNESKDGPEMATLYDIRMTCGMLGGKERTLNEFRSILRDTGFENGHAYINEGYNCYDAILANKVKCVEDPGKIDLIEQGKDKGFAA